MCVLSRGQYLGTGSCGRGISGSIMSCCVLWSCEAARWGTEEHCVLLNTAQLSRGLTDPGWEAPQGKHLLDTSVCLSVCLSADSSVCLPSSILYFYYRLTSTQSVTFQQLNCGFYLNINVLLACICNVPGWLGGDLCCKLTLSLPLFPVISSLVPNKRVVHLLLKYCT